MALIGRTRMKRAIPFLIKGGASVGETWITREEVCFVMRSHGKGCRRYTRRALHLLWFFGEEDRRGGRRPGLRGQGRTENFVRIIFRGDALLGGLRQMVIVCVRGG